MTFQYKPEWIHHPIPLPDGGISMLDPNELVPAPEGHPDRGKTGLEVTPSLSTTLVAEYKEKNTWAQMREYRDKELVTTDWTQGDDVPDTIKVPYQAYRKALREIGDATTTADVVWPTKPS
mgnify:CR=1 FL=1|tara:strand:- start:53 stop:415 length:363 start_codon:yes stop_codon:yes gene_type:complete